MSGSQEAKIHLSEDEAQTVLVAVAKQMPMEVKNPFVFGRYGECPICSKIVSCDEKYCSDCGQRIFLKIEKEFYIK